MTESSGGNDASIPVSPPTPSVDGGSAGEGADAGVDEPVTLPDHCANGSFDADDGESDADCGGPCVPCAIGLKCIAVGDCALGLACGADGVCDLDTCEDGALNGSETDVDCGGPDCFTRCVANQGCAETADCLESQCEAGQCSTATCSDLVLNGSETDVDCGGGFCEPCELGGFCLERSDCLADDVVASQCQSETFCARDGVQDVVTTTFECAPDNRCALLEVTVQREAVCQRDLTDIFALPDTPDPVNLDENCDGIDGDVASSVFVSGAAGVDANDGRGRVLEDGTLEINAVRTLRRGLELAAVCTPEPCSVLVAAGTYDQTSDEVAQPSPLAIPSGVRVYGGYTTDWQHTENADAVQITGEVSPTVIAESLTSTATLADLTIHGPDFSVNAPAGAESVAVMAATSTNTLVLLRVQIEGGHGAPGSDGAPGKTSTAPRLKGGAGGTSYDCGANSGETGEQPRPNNADTWGRGGLRGGSNCGGDVNACNVHGSVSDGWDGETDGLTGDNGARGSPPSNTYGDFVGLDWVPTPSESGQTGEAGGGGGGGGAGGSIKLCGDLMAGAPGGRGGDGGRAGTGGGGAGQGGAAFGVVVLDAAILFDGAVVHPGYGGAGGRGGNGGNGGDGLSGKAGGDRNGRKCCSVSTRWSGYGGHGSGGGGGGGGGGGAGGNGGPAVGLVLIGISEVYGTPTFFPGNGGTGGLGGTGGARGGGGKAGNGLPGNPGDIDDQVQL